MEPTVLSILGWIMIGLVVGVVPNLLIPRRNLDGVVVTTMLGIVGALIGGFIGLTLGWYGEEDLIGSVVAVSGSMGVLFAYRHIAAS